MKHERLRPVLLMLTVTAVFAGVMLLCVKGE